MITVDPSIRLQRKLTKARAAAIAAPDPAEKARLLKKIAKLKRRLAPPSPRPQSVPAQAFRLRHKWVK